MEGLLERYREGLRESVAELGELRRTLAGGDDAAAAGIRRFAHSIHGSGGTYGLPHLSACARLVEEAEDRSLLRRTDGFERILRRAAQPSRPTTWHSWAWLRRVAGLGPESPDGKHESDRLSSSASCEGPSALRAGWQQVTEESGLDVREVLARLSDEYHVECAEGFHGLALNEAALPAGTDVRLCVRVLADRRPGLRVVVADPTDLETEIVLEHLLGEQPILVVAPPGSFPRRPNDPDTLPTVRLNKA